MGFWLKFGKGASATAGVIASPIIIGMGIVCDTSIKCINAALRKGKSTLCFKLEYYMKAENFANYCKKKLHESLSPANASKPSLLTKLTEKVILGLSTIITAVISVVIVAKLVPISGAFGSIALGSVCLGTAGGAIYRGYRSILGGGKKDRNLSPEAPAPQQQLAQLQYDEVFVRNQFQRNPHLQYLVENPFYSSKISIPDERTHAIYTFIRQKNGDIICNLLKQGNEDSIETVKYDKATTHKLIAEITKDTFLIPTNQEHLTSKPKDRITLPESDTNPKPRHIT